MELFSNSEFVSNIAQEEQRQRKLDSFRQFFHEANINFTTVCLRYMTEWGGPQKDTGNLDGDNFVLP